MLKNLLFWLSAVGVGVAFWAAVAAYILSGCAPQDTYTEPAPRQRDADTYVVPSEIDPCWPEDQRVSVTITRGADDCGIKPAGQDEAETNWIAWWNSDTSCAPIETIGECTREVHRLCDDGSTIQTTYAPVSDDGTGLLVVGFGAYTFEHFGSTCTGTRYVEIRSVE